MYSSVSSSEKIFHPSNDAPPPYSPYSEKAAYAFDNVSRPCSNEPLEKELGKISLNDDDNASIVSLMIGIQAELEKFQLYVRDFLMQTAAKYILERVDQFQKAVDNMIASYKEGTGVEISRSKWESWMSAGVGVIQILIIAGAFKKGWSPDLAIIPGQIRDSLIMGGLDAYRFHKERLDPKIKGEKAGQEKALNDVLHQIEQFARDFFIKAADMFTNLTNMLAELVRSLQNILGLRKQ